MTGLPVADAGTVRRAAVALVRSDPSGLLLACTLTTLGAASGLVAPVLVGMIVDNVVAGRGLEAIDRIGLLLVLAALIQLILIGLARTVGLRWGERAAARLREQLATRVLSLPGRRITATGTGDLTARATTDVGLVSTVLRDAVPEIAFAAVQAMIVIVALFLLDVRLGVSGTLGLIGIALALRWYLRRARSAYLAQSAANAELGEILQATATGGRTVELLRLQERRRRFFAGGVVEARRHVRATLRLRTVLFTSIDVAHAGAGVLVLIMGGLLVFDGGLSVGVVIAALLYVNRLSVPLDTLLVWTETLQSALASFARIEGVGQAAVSEPTTDRRPVGEELRVDDVTFAYEGGADVLHGVTFTVRAGERLAGVGASGAGKSTLARLLAGVERPRRGGVTVGGVPVADLAPERLREHVLLVTQDHHVFADSLRANLLLAAPDADDDQLFDALRSVGARWAEPGGLDTVLDPELVDGARAQQLALARVLLADPHTLVLDEATALLDPTSARGAERTLARALAGRTVIAVAHRLQTARDADRVVVMSNGQIVEQGTHDELIAAAGPYADLWSAWHG